MQKLLTLHYKNTRTQNPPPRASVQISFSKPRTTAARSAPCSAYHHHTHTAGRWQRRSAAPSDSAPLHLTAACSPAQRDKWAESASCFLSSSCRGEKGSWEPSCSQCSHRWPKGGRGICCRTEPRGRKAWGSGLPFPKCCCPYVTTLRA